MWFKDKESLKICPFCCRNCASNTGKSFLDSRMQGKKKSVNYGATQGFTNRYNAILSHVCSEGTIALDLCLQ